MSTNLVGKYQLDKANLLSESQNLHLVIGTRKKTTPQKPPFYLLQRVSSKQHIYISSLFEWQEMTGNSLVGYSFDWQGTEYVLMLNHNTRTAQITLLIKQPGKEVAAG